MLPGTLQPRKAPVQIFPSATALEGPTAHKRTQSPGPQECAYATDGHRPRTTRSAAWPSANSGKISDGLTPTP